MKSRWLIFLLSALLVTASCATKPPVRTSLSAITQNPAEYKDQNVQVTAPVLENPSPQGDVYRTWNFIIGSPETGRVLVTEAGYNPSAINKAYTLVQEAKTDGQPITVTGKVRVAPHKALQTGTEIDLRSVTYKGTTVTLEEGPFGTAYYPYPELWYARPMYWSYYPLGFGPFGYGYGDFDPDEDNGNYNPATGEPESTEGFVPSEEGFVPSEEGFVPGSEGFVGGEDEGEGEGHYGEGEGFGGEHEDVFGNDGFGEKGEGLGSDEGFGVGTMAETKNFNEGGEIIRFSRSSFFVQCPSHSFSWAFISAGMGASIRSAKASLSMTSVVLHVA
jgi:hypothetical protein